MVSEELHFGRAAERLFMAQPPLSQAIRKLEDELGVQLLDRTSRQVTLTEAGGVFAKKARKLLASFEVAVAEARRTGGGVLSLRIGFPPYLSTGPLVRFLDALHEREPRVQPEVRHLFATEQVAELQHGQLDIGIFPGIFSDGSTPKLQTARLCSGEQIAAFLMPDHPLAAKTVLGPDDLAEELLVSSTRVNPALFASWLHELERVGYRFRGLHEAGDDLRDMLLAVAAGAGVALLSTAAPGFGDAGTIVVRRPLDPPLVTPDTVVAWRTRPPAQLKALIPMVRELARELRETSRSRSSARPRRTPRSARPVARSRP
jgi:DNA-binding transcriptional LysR family regulator